MKTILVDQDSTLNLFTQHLANWIVARGYTLTDRVNQTWSLTDWIADTEKKEASKVIADICCTPGFWLQIPVMRDAPRMLKKINDKYNVLIVTTPWQGAALCEQEKIEWMAKYCPYIRRDQIIFATDKWELGGDIIIDDRPEALEKFKGITIAIDYGYNHNVKVDYRVNNWIEIAKILKV